MRRFSKFLLSALLAWGADTAVAAPADALEVRLSAPTPVLQGDVDVHLTVTITNTGRSPVQLLRWQLPGDELESALFRITRDGQKVAYTGPLIKRTAPEAADQVRIDAGATLTYQVELTGAYDLVRNGRYTIEFNSKGGHGAKAAQLRSQPLYLWLEGRTAKVAGGAGTAGGAAAAAAVGSISFTGNCSASQQTALQQAVTAATGYANSAVSYLSSAPSATPRYVKWFGAYSSAGWGTAKAHFVNEQSAFTTQALTLDCKCKKSNIYAYVYPTQPYKIYLCGAFWAAPLTGTDSRAGTLIHEMSHFNVVAGTDDWAYGQSAAANLALTDPAKALDNADSHEYFAENTPALP